MSTIPSDRSPAPAIRHERDGARFVATVDGRDAVLEYRLDGDVLTVTHTEVPAELGGRGIAGHLVRAAFDHARAAGQRVRTECSYAAAWAQRHADGYRDLLVD